jgi:hypothetical protein
MTDGPRTRALAVSTREWLVRTFALAAACALSACIGGQTGQSAAEGQGGRSGCIDERSAIARDQVSELGFSADQGAAGFATRRDLALVWLHDASTVPAQIALQYDAPDAVFVREECVESLELAVTLSFRSDDGQLDEQLPATLIIRTAQRAALTARVALGELRGDYDGQLDGAADLRDPELVFEGRFEATENAGVLSLVEAATNGGGQRSIIVGRWSLAR